MLAILDYEAGNIESVRLALRRVGGDPSFVRDADEGKLADRLVFPGVGAAGQCMANLRSRGFDSFLKTALARNIPILAICVGMQLLFDHSDEDGGVDALGILPGTVRRFRPASRRDKVPHIGWNRAETPRRHPLLPQTLHGADFYFVHSYYAEPAWEDPAAAHSPLPPGRAAGTVYGATGYAGISFASMVGLNSLFATQFHPEKSAAAGLDLLARFLAWDGKPC